MPHGLTEGAAGRHVPEPRPPIVRPLFRGDLLLPSGLNATAPSTARCGNGGPDGRPVAASQSRVDPSASEVSTGLPSGVDATEKIRRCASGPGRGMPVATSQSRAVWSQLAVSDGLAVGAERHRRDLARC